MGSGSKARARHSFSFAAPVLTVGSSMDIGDYPGGQLGDVYVFTNANEVLLYKNDVPVDTLAPVFPGVMRLRDTVGRLLETQEGYPPRKAALLHRRLVSIGKKGLSGLSLPDYLRMAAAMVQCRLRMEDAVKLYGKYIGNWGGEATAWRFDAVRDGRVTASATCCPSTRLQLEVIPSSTVLQELQSYDMAAVRIRILDEYGNIAPYAQLPVSLRLEGTAQLVGPDTITAEGGMTGTFIRTAGKSGSARLTVSTPQTEAVCVEFTVR